VYVSRSSRSPSHETMPEYEISCVRLSELTTDYLEGALDSRLRTTFEQHATLCDACSVHLDQLRATQRILASLPAPPADEQRELLARLGTDGD
jgi:anti-sigma factor RsiW